MLVVTLFFWVVRNEKFLSKFVFHPKVRKEIVPVPKENLDGPKKFKGKMKNL